MTSVRNARRARCDRKLIQKPRKTVVYHRGVWEFDASHQDPGNLKLQQNRRNPRFYYKGVWEFPGAPCGPGRTYPQVIHMLFTMGEFGSLSLNSPLEYDLMLLWSEQVLDLLPESSLEFLGL